MAVQWFALSPYRKKGAMALESSFSKIYLNKDLCYVYMF